MMNHHTQKDTNWNYQKLERLRGLRRAFEQRCCLFCFLNQGRLEPVIGEKCFGCSKEDAALLTWLETTFTIIGEV